MNSSSFVLSGCFSLKQQTPALRAYIQSYQNVGIALIRDHTRNEVLQFIEILFADEDIDADKDVVISPITKKRIPIAPEAQCILPYIGAGASKLDETVLDEFAHWFVSGSFCDKEVYDIKLEECKKTMRKYLKIIQSQSVSQASIKKNLQERLDQLNPKFNDNLFSTLEYHIEMTSNFFPTSHLDFTQQRVIPMINRLNQFLMSDLEMICNNKANNRHKIRLQSLIDMRRCLYLSANAVLSGQPHYENTILGYSAKQGIKHFLSVLGYSDSCKLFTRREARVIHQYLLGISSHVAVVMYSKDLELSQDKGQLKKRMKANSDVKKTCLKQVELAYHQIIPKIDELINSLQARRGLFTAKPQLLSEKIKILKTLKEKLFSPLEKTHDPEAAMAKAKAFLNEESTDYAGDSRLDVLCKQRSIFKRRRTNTGHKLTVFFDCSEAAKKLSMVRPY